jgi:hypothetical protein
MESGTWYAAVLGDPEARKVYPDAPLLVEEWRTAGWRNWPWEVLARIAAAAARVGLTEAKAVALPGLQPRAGRGDARRSRTVPRARGTAFRFQPAADFARDEPRYPMRQRSRWLQESVFAGVASVWAATRAAGPCFQCRDSRDGDVPGAARLAIAHASDARFKRLKARPGAGDAALRKWHLQ